MEIKDKQNSYSSNSTAKKSIELKIGNYAKIMNIMRSSMYSNPIRTLVQEYISNAIDIHIETKQKRPVEICLPTVSNPTFSVRDFGTGLTETQMIEVYSQYGVSTKDKANDQQGGFGLGCKSFWAYNSVFYVTSFVNGKKMTYMAHLGKSDAGHFDLIGEEDTTEPNGLEVSGNVKDKDFNAFKDAIIRCSAFMAITPIIKGFHKDEVPEILKEQKPSINLPDVKVFNLEKLKGLCNSSTILVSIDNVIYELSQSQKNLAEYVALNRILGSNGVIILPVKVGILEVASSREALFDDSNDKTKNGLKKILSKALSDIVNYCNNEVKTIKTLKEFISYADKFNGVLSIQDKLNFVVNRIEFSIGSSGYLHSSLFEVMKIENVYKSWRRKKNLKIDEAKTISLKPEAKLLYQVGNVAKCKNRIEKLLNENPSITNVYVIHSNNSEQFEWLKKELDIQNIEDFEPLPSEKMPNYKPSNAKSKEEFCLHQITKNNSPYATTDFNKSVTHHRLDSFSLKTIYFVMEKNALPKSITDNGKIKEELDFLYSRDYILAGISETFSSKIKDNENFIEYGEFFKNLGKYAKPTNFDKDSILADYLSEDLVKYSKNLSKGKIDDKDFLDQLNEYDKVSKVSANKMTHYSFYTPIVEKVFKKQINELLKMNEELSKKIEQYPLVKTILAYDTMPKELVTELIFYINKK